MDTREHLLATDFGVVTGFAPQQRRLPAATRALAARYLTGEIGRGLQPAAFAIPPEFYLRLPTPNQIVAEAVRLVAERAPLRILPGEKLAGAATLREALAHQVPLAGFASVSHTTLGFEPALRLGLRGLRRRVEQRLRRGRLDAEARDLLDSMRTCLDAMDVWHARHVAELRRLRAASRGADRAVYGTVLAALRRVPAQPPRTFHEALQALWFLWDFQRLCGNWSGIGRFDKMLGPYLRRDLRAGRLTLDEARDLVAHFWIKGCEWITGEGRSSGDAQFYQNIVLAGVDERGRPVANAVTELVLDVVEELHISEFPIAVRLSRRTPEALLRRVAQVQRLGGGIVAVYNEDRIIDSLRRFGYPTGEARNFANDGCWEVLVPGRTLFGYVPFDALLLLQETLGLGPANDRPAACADFESLYEAFRLRLAARVTAIVNGCARSKHPAPLVSLFVEDCIRRGRGYYDGGPRYTVSSPHAGGLPDVADSLLALQRLVFSERQMPLAAFVDILRRDWDGHEDLRRRIRTRFPCYGNDDAEADAMLRRVFDDFTGLVAQVHERYGILRPAGISTFGREGSDFRPLRAAAASGRARGEILAPNFSPAPGADRQGPTAVIKSHCAVDFSRLPCGTALDLKLAPGTLAGEAGIRALTGLMRTFVELGGVFLQLDVVDTALLREAQAHPERYPNLAVRVSGWSARFATLSRDWQELIIAKSPD
jgi:formate C-acetyltransferase